MKVIQATLSIGDEGPPQNQAIIDYLRKLAEVIFQMYVSDPPLVFDMKRIGEKVQFNQFKFESIDGFIRNNEDCLIILPALHKLGPGGTIGDMMLKANVLPVSYEFPWKPQYYIGQY